MNSHIATEIRRYNVIEFTDEICHGLEQAIVREIPCLRENWGNITGEPLIEVKRVSEPPGSIAVEHSGKHRQAVEMRRKAYIEGRKRT
ncbi:MAG TPA: hypothetical protein PLZ31_02590 [Myxococcota bacterium]|nr:hypothetical protein [Myxococcota bacterium]